MNLVRISIPNIITMGRLLAVPLTVWLVLKGAYAAAFWVFVAAGISDAVDGFIAKRFNAETELGKYLDPLADKALLVSIYVTLGHEGQLPMWVVILVVFRDALIIGGALLYQTLTQSLRMEPLMISKLNTVCQILLAGAALLVAGYDVDGLLSAGVEVMVWVVGATTFLSGAAYVVEWGKRASAMEGAE